MSDQGSQGSQRSQGYNASLQPDFHTTDPDGSGSYKPDSRADAAPKPLERRERKWEDQTKLRLKNAQGILAYQVSIVSGRYDEGRHSWMYKLKDWQNKPIAGETRETMLG